MPSNSFKFKARYGLERTITKLDENTYSIEGPSMYVRMASFPDEEIKNNPTLIDKLYMIDFEGGPAMFVGGYFVQLPHHMWSDRTHLPLITELTVDSNTEGHFRAIVGVKKDNGGIS